MWSQIFLCLLVGFALASENPAWNEQYHYVYQVRGRSLASLNQISNDYSGVIFKAQLHVQPQRDGNLGAKLSNVQYAQLHAELEEGWETEIPDSQLNYKELPLSNKPFNIVLKKGAIRNVIVSKELKNWEANMIKSIVSQLQLDTKAVNLIPSSINILTQEDSNTAVFKTMEETVTGVAETLYEIHPFPEYVLQSQPWIVPHKHLAEQGEVIEIVKNKNFTHSPQNPSYHAGLEGISGYQPGNKIGKFLSRAAVSQAVITGTLQKYTIQSSVTTEEIVLRPTLVDQQRGSVNSKLNVTIMQVEQATEENQFEVENPVSVGVVYGYDKPFGTDNSPRSVDEYNHESAHGSSETDSSETDSMHYSRRSMLSRNYLGDDEEQGWYQDKPQVSQAPPNPLLPFTVGYNGQSIKKQQNIVDTVRSLAEEIGQEFPNPTKVLQQHTLGKFVILSSLVRVMDQGEIQQVASQLHSSEKSPAWVAFRDAVAEAGTGPALQTIKDWIKNEKVTNLEAAQIIATAASSARQPTLEYIKVFNEMMQDKTLMEKPHLNESIILSYTTLVRQVAVNDEESQGKYPVNTYGTFRTMRLEEYVKKEVIPYLTKQLSNAINKADTIKIHTYIRALGNIGKQEILEAFEPYLEGQRKASNFQRVLMVQALDQLVKSNPVAARSVLYKIYQNPTEIEQVRVAAVFQLMRTRPSAELLQRMALYTHEDTSNYVNAAVKSSIESAAELKAPEHHELRVAAQSAKPLLTSKKYGAQYSQGYLRSYAVQELKLGYQQHMQSYGREDHAVPRGIKYTLQRQLGGVKDDLIRAEAMVSSIEDLVNVFQQQTSEYQREQKQKQEQQASQYPWSSEYIAKILNLQNEQREQLEGNMMLQIGALQTIFSFDNLTLEDLPRAVKELEEKLRQGKHYQYSKMIIGEESSVAFPTVLGLPFIYTYDRPTFMRVKTDVKVSARPSISNGETLDKPENVEAEFVLNAAITGRIQTQLGIFTPFDHQRYSAGYIKNFQLVLPLTGKAVVDVQKHQLTLEIQNPAEQQNVRLAHYSSWPYTSQNEIYAPKPSLKVIRSEHPYRKNVIFGDKSTGLAVHFQITSDEIIDYSYIYEKLRRHDAISALFQPWTDEHIQYVHADIGIDSEKSTAKQVIVRLSYKTDYQQNESSGTKPDPNEQVSDIPSFPEEPEQRQTEFIKRLGNYISNAEVIVADTTVEFQGQTNIKYSLTAGVAKSNVDSYGRFMALVKKTGSQGSQTLGYVQAISVIPNTNGLDLDYAMSMDPKSMVYVQGLLRHEQRLSKVNAQIELSKSQDRVQYLKELKEYEQCKHQMQQGNYALPACAKMTAKANLLDKFYITMKYNDMDSRIINATYKAYSVLRHHLYPRVDENILFENKDQLVIHGQFSPCLNYLNASIVSEWGKAELKDQPIHYWAREFLVPHPVFHTRARLEGQALKEDTYRPICVVDKTMTNTFDNKTYPSSFSNIWTVLMQYVPRRPSSVPNKPEQSVTEQLHECVESYVVYTRSSEQSSSEKEVQVVFQMPSTQGKIVKIVMKPTREGKVPKVLINEQEVNYSEERSADFYQGHVQIYALPNQEVKVELRHAFYIIFDGQTVKLTAINSKLRDSVRGLCGTFTGEPETDFVTPENCIIHDPQQFIESYTVSGLQPRDSKKLFKREHQDEKCYQKKVVFANYISNQDAGRATNYERRSGEDCTGHLTRYMRQGTETCFTLRALPFCKPGCKALQMNSKPVEVRCLESSRTTDFWASQIDMGKNQHFSNMEPTGKLTMDVPVRCVPV